MQHQEITNSEPCVRMGTMCWTENHVIELGPCVRMGTMCWTEDHMHVLELGPCVRMRTICWTEDIPVAIGMLAAISVLKEEKRK